jgi:hypothetical protein
MNGKACKSARQLAQEWINEADYEISRIDANSDQVILINGKEMIR